MIDIIIISLFCNGWYLITRDGLILDPVRRFYLDLCGVIEQSNGEIKWEKGFHKFLYQPVFGCIICMASIPGSIAYWTINEFTEDNLIQWPIYIICVAFVNYLFYLLIKNMEK
jgi:hypothetical protein